MLLFPFRLISPDGSFALNQVLTPTEKSIGYEATCQCVDTIKTSNESQFSGIVQTEVIEARILILCTLLFRWLRFVHAS